MREQGLYWSLSHVDCEISQGRVLYNFYKDAVDAASALEHTFSVDCHKLFNIFITLADPYFIDFTRPTIQDVLPVR